MKAAKKSAGLKRVGIKLVKGRLAKAILYKTVSDSFMKEINAIQQDYCADQLKLYENGKPIVWHDWLKKKAWEGHDEALEVLRHRYDKTYLKMNTIAGEANVSQGKYLADSKIETVTKRGTIHYQIDKSVLRDDGKVFRLAENTGREVIEAALKMSIKRFGNQLTINGTDAFRMQVADVAAKAKLNVVFSKPNMEAQPQETSITVEEAVSRYIDERNKKRIMSIDNILPHRRYNNADAGKHSFAGLRQIQDKTLMLLKTPSEMLVLPIDEVTVNHIKRISVGKRISVTEHGKIRSLKRKIN